MVFQAIEFARGVASVITVHALQSGEIEQSDQRQSRLQAVALCAASDGNTVRGIHREDEVRSLTPPDVAVEEVRETLLELGGPDAGCTHGLEQEVLTALGNAVVVHHVEGDGRVLASSSSVPFKKRAERVRKRVHSRIRASEYL
jgi:hypothetical protein